MSTCHLLQNHRDDVSLLITAQHEIHSWSIDNLLRLELSIATRDHHKSTRISLDQSVDSLSALVVCNLRHTARIDHHHISHLTFLHFGYTMARELLRHRARFSKIQLASQCEIGSLLSLQYA